MWIMCEMKNSGKDRRATAAFGKGDRVQRSDRDVRLCSARTLTGRCVCLVFVAAQRERERQRNRVHDNDGEAINWAPDLPHILRR